jgi:serine/threonine protein kinase
LIDTTDWSRLGDTLAAAGLFREAGEAHGAAAAAAKAVADRQAEAEAEYKRFRDACETGDRSAAMSAFRRAVDIGPEQFAPFDLHRYKPEEVLGSGGFGTVFLAEDVYVRVDKERRPQKVAIKAFHDAGWDAILERDLAESFDEADTLSTLSDAGIVKSLNRGFGDPARRKRPYIVMEYFPGVTLEAWLKARGTLPLRDVLAIAEQVAKAVSEAHRLQILHRDLKPANVMVRFSEATRQWEVKVIDFGLAVKTQVARTSTGVPSNRRAALDRSLAGTFRYSPPEQRNELEADVGPYSDVYAFGKTCLDLLFATTEPKSLHWKRLPPEHRDRVQSLFEQATVDELEHRFQNFEPVRNELAGLLRDLSADGPTHEPTRDEPTPARDSGNSGAPKPKTDRAARPDVKPAPAPDPAPDSNQTAKSARERREPPRPPLTIWERVRQLGGSPAKRVIAGAPFSKAGEETAEEGSRNLLCPNCHSPLGVPDIYAGQLMKCPLCKQNFTVPSLPGSAATVDPPGGRRTDPSQSSSKSDVVTTEQDRMNLLCPSCDNVLTVPKQYAGQMMKCPVCMNNFTVPKPPPT